MAELPRERRIVETFVALSDTLLDDYDVVELTQTLVDQTAELFDAVSAGLVLADLSGRLEVLASTDEDTRLIELLQLDAGDGPCVLCYQSGEPVTVVDARDVADEWSAFRERAEQLGIRAAHCVPMRLRGSTIGSLNLFRGRPGELEADDLAVAQAFADVATIGILHQRAFSESDLVRRQLQHALDSRILIEQAKGVLAYGLRISVEEAFEILRDRARSTSTSLTTIAERVVSDYQR